jgi:hypothetical protein
MIASQLMFAALDGLPTDRFGRTWRACSSVARCSIAHVAPMIRRHYLRRRPAVVVDCFALLVRGLPLGCVVFALPPPEIATRYSVASVWELARLWVDDSIPKNAETYLIGRVVRQLRSEGAPSALVSYADPSRGHAGTIYRAAGWTYDGMTDSERKTPRFDYVRADGTRVGRAAHRGAEWTRIARVSKHRFVLLLKPPSPGAEGKG